MSSFLDAKIELQNEINKLENGATVVDTTLYQVQHEEFHYYIGKKDIAGIYELEKIKSKLSAFNEYLSDTFINSKEKVDKVINETKILDSFYFELLKKVSANFKNKKYGDALDLIDSFKLDIPKSNSISALNAHVIYTNTRFVLLHYVLSEKRNDNSFVENTFNYLINEDYRLLSTNVNEFGPEMFSTYFDTIINKSNTNYDYLEKLISILCFSEKFYNKHIDFFADCYAKILSEVERLIAIYEDKFFRTDASLSECNKLYDLIHTSSLSFAHSVVCFGGTKDDLVKEFYKLNASKMSPEELEKSFIDLLKQIDESDFGIYAYTEFCDKNYTISDVKSFSKTFYGEEDENHQRTYVYTYSVRFTLTELYEVDYHESCIYCVNYNGSDHYYYDYSVYSSFSFQTDEDLNVEDITLKPENTLFLKGRTYKDYTNNGFNILIIVVALCFVFPVIPGLIVALVFLIRGIVKKNKHKKDSVENK